MKSGKKGMTCRIIGKYMTEGEDGLVSFPLFPGKEIEYVHARQASKTWLILVNPSSIGIKGTA